MRYLIAYLLPPHIEYPLRQSYQLAFNEPIRIKQLHITLLPTFTFKQNDSAPESLIKLKSTLSNTSSTPPVMFAQPEFFSAHSGIILYLPITPQQPFIEKNKLLMTHSLSFIDFDLSMHHNHKLPSYLPHVSLSYNFTSQTLLHHFNYPRMPFSLARPVILQENSPTNWQVTH